MQLSYEEMTQIKSLPRGTFWSWREELNPQPPHYK
jgi:hypothetical protein